MAVRSSRRLPETIRLFYSYLRKCPSTVSKIFQGRDGGERDFENRSTRSRARSPCTFGYGSFLLFIERKVRACVWERG